MAKVSLSDDYYIGEHWTDHTDGKIAIYGYHDVYEIPVEQRDRWQAAMDAYQQMQGEIRELMRERREAKMADRAGQEQRQQAREALLVRPWRKT